jgi:hypothetical protein
MLAGDTKMILYPTLSLDNHLYTISISKKKIEDAK